MKIYILWHVDPLPGGDCGIGDYTSVLARQRHTNYNKGMVFSARSVKKQLKSNKGMVFSARSAKKQLKSNRGTMFSVRSVPRCYKQDEYRV
jgi:hypothetical protein